MVVKKSQVLLREDAAMGGTQVPVYRGGPALGPPPMLARQEGERRILCDEFHENGEP